MMSISLPIVFAIASIFLMVIGYVSYFKSLFAGKRYRGSLSYIACCDEFCVCCFAVGAPKNAWE